MNDSISRQKAIKSLREILNRAKAETPEGSELVTVSVPVCVAEALAYSQSTMLTDKEKRIFLAAMSREERVCEEMDRNYMRELYEDSLMSICREIKRKVKGALWA